MGGGAEENVTPQISTDVPTLIAAWMKASLVVLRAQQDAFPSVQYISSFWHDARIKRRSSEYQHLPVERAKVIHESLVLPQT